jgi:molybdopterin converting factor subunit 1
MSIRILFFASLADITGIRETTVDAALYSDIRSIFSRFAADYPQLEARRPSIIYALNSEFARPESEVGDGDEVAFLPPVSGG